MTLVQVLPDSARDLGITDERCFATGRDAAVELVLAYLSELGEDLAFQGVEAELAALTSKYGPPKGAFFLVWIGDRAAGCAGFRDLGDGVAEMKRLYVRPEFRGRGVASRLLRGCLDGARNLGHSRMVLDTLERLESANRLYRSSGFREIPAYYGNPLPGVVYFGRDL